MNRPPAAPIYVKDWLSSARIAMMTPAEEGGYLRLLLHEWESDDCTLPDDDKQLAVLSRLGTEWFSYADGTNPVRNCFVAHPSKKLRLINKRLHAEWKKLRTFRRERAESGRKGAVSRWKSRDRENSSANGSAIAQPIAEGMAKNGSSYAFASSNSNSKIKKTTAHSDVLNGHRPGFVQFWNAYPKKIGKKKSEKVWAKLKPDDALVAVMLTALEQVRRTPQWTKDSLRYVPHPTTWLNGEAWKDEITASPHVGIDQKNFHEGAF